MRIKESYLADHADFFNGKAPAGQRDFGPYPIFGSNGIIGYCEEFNHENGIILGRVGAYCGSVEICQGKFWASDNTIVVKPRGENDLVYLYYRLKSTPIRGFAGGAAQPLMTHGILRNVCLPFANEDMQPRISQVLKSYDDLIANNRERIKLLEQSARLLFQEWFVRLRYPGHEHDKIVDRVPKGWERKSAFDTIDILSGGTPKTSVPDYWDGDIPFYTPKDAAEFPWVLSTVRSITERGLNNCNSRLYPKGTVFISARGTVGKLNLAQRSMAMSQSCYGLVGRGNMSQLLVYCAMESALAVLQQQAGGAVFNAIIVDTFKRIPVLIPSREIARAFEELVFPMFAQIELLQCQNDKLVKARDLLLPRLMDGRIAV